MSNDIAYTMTLRCRVPNMPGALGRLTSVIGDAGGNIGAIDIVNADRHNMIRDITVRVNGEQHGKKMVEMIDASDHADVLHVSDRVFLTHLGGKLAVKSKVPIKTRDDLSLAYTPGVARVCQAIADDESAVYALTMKRNSVAIVTDGSAVLGMGNIGSKAALPVMEGKAILFKEFADIDGYPICLKGQDVETIVETIVQIAPTFGAINLEDIAAPACFEVERQLQDRLDIAVMHDDQHGTAVVVLAGLYNALKLVGKPIEHVRVVVNGIGAAGTAIVQILLAAGVGEVTAVDRAGILNIQNSNLSSDHQEVAQITNQSDKHGDLADALVGADVFIGVSIGNILSPQMVEQMADDAIVFMLANPIPEGDPNELYDIARIVATGRSDFPNQINNALAFPGIFRGILDVNATIVTPALRLAAAHAMANLIEPEALSEDYIIPSLFNRDLVPAIAAAVAQSAIEEGVARRHS